jgi:hypothetical protein
MGNTETTGENDRGLEEMSASDSQKDWSQNGMAVVGEQEEDTLTVPSFGIEDEFSCYEELAMDIEISASNELYMSHNVGLLGMCCAEYGTEFTLALTFVNNSAEAVVIDPAQPGIVVRNRDDETVVDILPVIDGPGELLPSESFQIIYVWNQQDKRDTQVPPGRYQFDVSYIFNICGEDWGEIPLPEIVVVIEEPE